MTNPAGYSYTPLPARPDRQLAERRAARRRRVRRRRVLPVRRRPHRGRAARRARPGPGEHGLARLRQPGRGLPDLRIASRTWHPADGVAEHRRVRRGPGRLGGGPPGRCRDRRARPLQLRLAVADDPRRRAGLPDTRRRPHPRARGGGPRRMVQPLAQPHPGDPEPVGRDRVSLPARPAPGRPARLADHGIRSTCWRSRTTRRSTTRRR